METKSGEPNPVAYTITRTGKPDKSETVRADSVQIEQGGDAPKYVFQKDGKVVLEIFVHALASQPKPEFPRTPESKAAWKKFRQKASAVTQPRHLRRD